MELQPLTWIRPSTLSKDKLDGYVQVVGHTTVPQCHEYVKDLWLCDALENKSYLIINNNKFYESIYN